MTEVINPIWNIFEPPLVDNSIKSYDYKEFKENNVTVANLDRYEISTKNSKSWKHLANGYLYVKAIIKGHNNNYVTVTNNGLNDFKLARLFYENKLIEEINYVGIATTVTNLAEMSGDISSSEASQMMWYLDGADSAETHRFTYEIADKAVKFKDLDKSITDVVRSIKHNPKFNEGFLQRYQLTNGDKAFCKFIPLKRLFRFCRDVNKVIKGEIKIVLEKNHQANILHSTVEGADYAYEISDLSVWIPEVEPSLSVLATLEANLGQQNQTFYGWNAINCYLSGQENTASGTWRVVNSQNKVNGVWVVFSKAARENSFIKSNMIFDHNDLDSIHIRVNGRQYPLEEYRCSFETKSLNCARIYSAFLAGSGFKPEEQGTSVSFKDYALLYPIIYFDLSKQEDEAYTGLAASELEVRWRLKKFTENYYLYAVVQSERKAEVNVLDHQIYLTM